MAKNSFKDQLNRAANRDLQTVMIEQELASLFFKKKDVDGELAFMRLLLTREGESQERYGLHASAMLASDNEFCLREQVLSLFYKQIQDENIPPPVKRVFEEGHYVHQKWQRLLIRGRLGKPEDMDHPNFLKKYDLSFTPDAEIKIMQHSGVLVEIKSMNTYAFQKAQSHPSGEKQLNFYLCVKNRPWGFVLAEDKNTQDFKVFIVKKDLEKAKPYLHRLVVIQEAKERFIEAGKLPKKKCSNCDIKRAVECNMRDACFNVGMGRVKLHGKSI